MTTIHARHSDPITSHRAVTAIAADQTLATNIMAAAHRLHQGGQDTFDDTDLLVEIEDAIGRRQQRNVIARSRGLMEADGMFVRVGERPNADRPSTLHFRLPSTCIQLEMFA